MRERQVGQQLNLDKSTASRRLKVAAKKGFVTNLETRKGHDGKWRVSDQEVDEATDSLLPSVEEIRAWMSSPRDDQK
jgi:predicted transcriptional regulator